MFIREIYISSPEIEIIRQINEEAFPPDERMPVEEMFTFNIASTLFGFFDEDRIVGFSLVLLNGKTAFVVLLAIDKDLRGKGYGSQALKAMMQECPDKQFVLDFEEVTESAENYEQRLSRKNFYLRNGFYETGRFTVLCGDQYEVVCSGGDLEEIELYPIMSAIHEHTPEFDSRLR